MMPKCQMCGSWSVKLKYVLTPQRILFICDECYEQLKLDFSGTNDDQDSVYT